MSQPCKNIKTEKDQNNKKEETVKNNVPEKPKAVRQDKDSNDIAQRLQLPKVRGRYSFDVPMANFTWFKVGGPAQVIFKPADILDLIFFLKNRPKDLPITTLGVGSNVIVRDNGIKGVVIRLGKGFNNIIFNNDNTVDVGTAVLDKTLALMSRDNSLSGAEFLCSIPGTIGGALRMNAGCYGSEIKDILEFATAVDKDGNVHKLSNQEMGFSYRHCSVPDDWIFIGARLKLSPGNREEIGKKINEMLSAREETQPINTQTGGSTFANPKDNDKKAWELIDGSGLRGFKIGGAMVSTKHCNFLINTGNATAKDLETLGETIRKRVKEKYQVTLNWEIKRIGEG